MPLEVLSSGVVLRPVNAFAAHWAKIRGDDHVNIRTILCAGRVAGYVASFEREGEPEVTYWLGKEYWGQGIATQALAEFLGELKVRPLYARAATDNIASIRVLAKCGFTIAGYDSYFRSPLDTQLRGDV